MKLKIVKDGSIGNTPAAVSRDENTVYINPELYDKLSPFAKKFVLAHEVGHYTLNTRSETDADTYALNKLAGTQYQSLKKCINTIKTTLPKTNSTKETRFNNIVYQALKWDYEHGNKAVYEDYLNAMNVCYFNGNNNMNRRYKHNVYTDTKHFMARFDGEADAVVEVNDPTPVIETKANIPTPTPDPGCNAPMARQKSNRSACKHTVCKAIDTINDYAPLILMLLNIATLVLIIKRK